jgi:hypothetical protein
MIRISEKFTKADIDTLYILDVLRYDIGIHVWSLVRRLFLDYEHSF